MSDNLQFVDWHLRSGYLVIGLLTFRICWGLWGTRYARFGAYRTTPRAVFGHFAMRRTSDPAQATQVHTAPGVVMAWVMWFTCLVQAAAGLFTSDDIFTEGPLVRYVDDAQVDAASFLHTRVFWLLLALATAHLVAIAWYGLIRRDPVSLSMFSGRKAVSVEPVGDRPLAAACAWLAAAAVVAWLAML